MLLRQAIRQAVVALRSMEARTARHHPEESGMKSDGLGCGGLPDSADDAEHRPQRGAQLAPWQVKLAKDEIVGRLTGGMRITDVAGKLGLSVTHFAKAFRNSVGDTPYRWYQRERIARSMLLLSDTRRSLAEIASECGFTDESHYITAFARTVGVTPGRWRRRRRLDAG